MVKTIIIDPSKIKWKDDPVLYRGHTQESFERQIAKSFVQGKPTYHGNAYDDDTDAALNFVSLDLGYAIGYAQYNMKRMQRGFPELTRYPIIFGIRAERYFDKLRYIGGGIEGLCIEGDIDANDITVLFSSEVNRVLELEQSSKVQEYLTNLNRAITTRGLDPNKSIVKNPQLLRDLVLICFNYPMYPLSAEQEQKFVEAMAYLKRKLEGH